MSVASYLAGAKNAAGARAVLAAGKGDHVLARRWSDFAVQIDALLRDAVALMAGTAEPPATHARECPARPFPETDPLMPRPRLGSCTCGAEPPVKPEPEETT